MYNNKVVFLPQYIYLMINFENIKNNLKNMKSLYKDYGSIIALQDKDILITVNSIGKVEILFDDSIKQQFVDEDLYKIENIFRKQISDFKLIKN